MPWTTPVDRSTGYLVTATDWNATGQDDLTYLYGDTTWTTISVFTGTWTAGATTPQYSRTGNVVFLRGQVSAGTINTAAFTLPAGYRPSVAVPLAVIGGGNVFGQLNVANTGVCTPVVGGVTNFNLACSFSII